ncbi:hypothetical protein BDZ90DRAFT_232703 [Jaminaea rosea]|uniref:BOD1/SHG1 domain-containing protein n=1 Tax=Jaminaea rosea TaxID=1569628 RepID=A0A316UPC4_9BASI|nr:hypothetical protein BDZ90DRAFT_232703 [Jaminaea rosea]PWN27147.1 hypothetical protein BDZ90DRAFT_232703 [Jaminaea rosea]
MVKHHVNKAIAAVRSPPHESSMAGREYGDDRRRASGHDVWTPASAGGGGAVTSRDRPPPPPPGESDVWTPASRYGQGYGLTYGSHDHRRYGDPSPYGAGRRRSSAGRAGPSGSGPRSSSSSDHARHRDGGHPSSISSSSTRPPPPSQHDIEEALRIDWPDVESRAKANGFVTPSDLVVEFKRQGHFDSLRRSLLQSFLSSSPQAKGDVTQSISDLLLSYIQGNPAEAAKIMATSGGDVRLMQAEMVKVVEMDEPDRARVKRAKGDQDEETEEYMPPSGPKIQRDLLAKMQQPPAATVGEDEEGKERDAIISILSTDLSTTSSAPSEPMVRTIQERVQALLREEEEKRGKMVDREGEERTAASSGEGTPATNTNTPIGAGGQGKVTPATAAQAMDEDQSEASVGHKGEGGDKEAMQLDGVGKPTTPLPAEEEAETVEASKRAAAAGSMDTDAAAEPPATSSS